MCCQKHTCVVVVETPASATIVKFPDNADIRDGKIRSILVRRSGDETLYSQSGAELIGDAAVAGATIMLVNARNIQVLVAPMSMLQRDFNAPEPYNVDPDAYGGIDLTRSQVALRSSDVDADKAVEVVFEYECKHC